MQGHEKSIPQMVGESIVGLIFIIGFVMLLGLLAMFVWDAGVAWLFPNAPTMGYGTALAFSTAIVAGHLTLRFWFNRVMRIQQSKIILKSIEAGTMSKHDD